MRITGELCKYVGGKEYVHVLLSPLELLICGEESSVRAKVGINVCRSECRSPVLEWFLRLMHL